MQPIKATKLKLFTENLEEKNQQKKRDENDDGRPTVPTKSCVFIMLSVTDRSKLPLNSVVQQTATNPIDVIPFEMSS